MTANGDGLHSLRAKFEALMSDAGELSVAAAGLERSLELAMAESAVARGKLEGFARQLGAVEHKMRELRTAMSAVLDELDRLDPPPPPAPTEPKEAA